jgi:aconitate hydratase
VAYALAGRADVDLTTEPIGTDRNGKPVFLSEIWPSQKEVADLEAMIGAEMFAASYGNVFDGNPMWNAIGGVEGDLYGFKEESTYLQDPPFFEGLTLDPKPLTDIRAARILAILGDWTTDHIAPAGDS